MPLAVVVIVRRPLVLINAPGGRHRRLTNVPVLPLSNRHSNGRSNIMPPMLLTFTRQIGAMSFDRLFTVLGVGMKNPLFGFGGILEFYHLDESVMTMWEQLGMVGVFFFFYLIATYMALAYVRHIKR